MCGQGPRLHCKLGVCAISLVQIWMRSFLLCFSLRMLRENVCQRASSLSLSVSALSGISLLHLQRHISTKDAVNGAGIKIRTRRSSNSEVKRKREKKTQKMQTKAGSPHGKCTPSAARSHLVTRHTSSHCFFFFSV